MTAIAWIRRLARGIHAGAEKSCGDGRGVRVGHMGSLAVLMTVAAALPCSDSYAQTRLPQPKPITREWICDNGRTVSVNYHPRRINEPAWLTYLGNRIEVARTRVDAGIVATSADGKVNWHEKGKSADLEFAGLLDQPLHCELKTPNKPGK